MEARYLKIHCKYDDWDIELNDSNEIVSIKNGQFKNLLKDMVKVYRLTNEAEIIYSYDDMGNRIRKTTGNEITDYSYYPGTNRLMDNEEYGYVYDDAGNLIKKGNRYSISGDTVTFTETEGEGVEYYEYEYNLQNRLSRVTKNGELIAEFTYDADGMRIKAEEVLEEEQTSKTTYYVYNYSGKILLEESVDYGGTATYSSYIYAFSKTFAKVDGVIDTAILATAEISYFHYDNVGSTRLMTDGEGKVVMDQDYLPFGGDLPKIGQTEVLNEDTEGYKYTGQKQVISIGLYYYGARYYDPSVGRFITEDPVQQGHNWYVYCGDNPIRYVDPTGMRFGSIDDSLTEEDMDFMDSVHGNSGSSDLTIGNTSSGNNNSGININIDPEFAFGFDPGFNEKMDPNRIADYMTNIDLKTLVDQISNNTDIETWEDIKIKLNQKYNNQDIEGFGYSYSQNITTGVIYDPLGLSRMRNVIGIKVNLDPSAKLQLSDGGISFKFDDTKIGINKKGISIDVNRKIGMGLYDGFVSVKSEFLNEFKNEYYKISPVQQSILPLNETESPLYIPIYKQQVSVSDAKGYVSLTYKQIYEWHQVTAVGAAALGYEGAMAGKEGLAAFGEFLRRQMEQGLKPEYQP